MAFAPKIVDPILEIMPQLQVTENSIACHCFIILSKIARYSGSRFNQYTALVLPNVYSTLMNDHSATNLSPSARALLIETFLAVGPHAFSFHLKEMVKVVIAAPPANTNDPLLFFSFLTEYTRDSISAIYPGRAIRALISKVVPFITRALDGASLLQSMFCIRSFLS